MNIVITGSSKGIGKALSLELMQRGHKVLGISRSDMPELSSVNGGYYRHLRFDLSSAELPGPLTDLIRATFPQVDVLVNNAGILINKPFTELTASDIDLMYHMHLRLPFLLTSSLIGLMPPGSHVVNIASMGGYQGSIKFAGLSAYSATKGALAILSEALAGELQELQINVNCLAIGAVQTEMLQQAFPTYKAPLNPEEFAHFAAWFCLEGNRYFNGKILPVSLSTP
jgi:3-oxoacyl-[acyl-carrier protein] reductase